MNAVSPTSFYNLGDVVYTSDNTSPAELIEAAVDAATSATEAAQSAAIASSALSTGGIDPTQAPYNAVADGITDNAAAFTAAVAALAAEGGSTLRLPVGNFYSSTGISDNGNFLRIVGVGDVNGTSGGTVITVGNNDVSAISLTGQRSGAYDLNIQGYNSLAATKPAVNMPGVETRLVRCRVRYGYYNINATGVDNIIFDVKPNTAYGPASIYGGCYLIRVKVDSPAPYPPAGVAIGNWTANQTVPANTWHYVNGYLCLTTAGGVSGATVPTPAIGTFVDGTVTWTLKTPATYAAVKDFTGFASDCDFSGPYSACIQGALSGYMERCAFQGSNYGIWAQSGAGVCVTASRFVGASAAPGSCAVLLDTGWASEATIALCRSNGYETGVAINGGVGARILENDIFATLNGVKVAPNINRFRIVGNNFNSPSNGAPTNGVVVGAGTSDHYDIIGNDVAGLTTPITDGGTGANKRVQDVNGFYDPMNLFAAQYAPSNPSGTTNTSFTMMGLGPVMPFTPSQTGKFLFTAQMTASNTVAFDGVTTQMKYGTGTAPANGVGNTGTTAGASITMTSPAASGLETVTVVGQAVSLVKGTTYWLDLCIKAATGGAASISGIIVTITELP